ncbi:MAG: hypothetical protein NVS4B8_11260 [Herpetosiphon sp.]
MTSRIEAKRTAGAELDYGVQSAFLSQLDQEQKLRIFDLTTRASRELHRWATRYPLIRRVRVWPLSLSVAAAAPFSTADALITMARMNLWVFTIDDLFDEEIVPFAELRRRVNRYYEVLAGARVQPSRERDTLVIALQDIRDDLKRYKLFDALQDQWIGAVSKTLDAMMCEHDWRSAYRTSQAATELPSYETYLRQGLYSIGGPPHIWTTLIAIGDESTLDHLPRLGALEQSASLCIRLANDLQSYAREIAEGKINGIVINQCAAMARGHTPEEAMEIACDIVRADMQRELEHCTELQHEAKTATGHPEQAIADIARFVCDFYVHHDYHTFSAGVAKL